VLDGEEVSRQGERERDVEGRFQAGKFPVCEVNTSLCRVDRGKRELPQEVLSEFGSQFHSHERYSKESSSLPRITTRQFVQKEEIHM
jgi:hypothetical protein